MTANHITAIVIPILGGIAWSTFGYQTTFLAGAAIVFADMLFAMKIPDKVIVRDLGQPSLEP
jgi:hypothetical protein